MSGQKSEQNSERITLSFYRYTPLAGPEELMLSLKASWQALDVLGRVYLAHEGINAQISVPTSKRAEFEKEVRALFPDIPFKVALQERAPSFSKLVIKVRPKLVGDGLNDPSFDASLVGTHLDANAFHAAMEMPGTLVVDMRNHYECEVGHFVGALLPEANTFREVLPEMLQKLQDAGAQQQKILLYCTGGIRCEKASAYLRHHGFEDVNQLHGGIIDYAHQIKELQVPSAYKGKNFVFDQRLNEAVTDDVIAHCHQCDVDWDLHSNCRFEGCNRLFLQCPCCAAEYDACCSRQCQSIMRLPKAERVAVQHEWQAKMGPDHYQSRTRMPEGFHI